MKMNLKEQQKKLQLLHLNSLAVDLILKSESKFQILALSTNSNEQSLEIYKNNTLTKLIMNYINLNICQLTAETISNLGKSIYSCKNIIKSQSFNKLSSLFQKDVDTQIIKQKTKQSTQIVLNNFKLIIFDSFFIKQNLEKEFLMPNMFKEADEKIFKDSFDRINTKSAFLIEFKIACVLSNDHQFIESLGVSDFVSNEQNINSFDTFQIFKIQNIHVYQNLKESTLTDLVQNSFITNSKSIKTFDENINYLTIIHPFDSLITILKQDNEIEQKQIIDIAMNSFELEMSIKQFFKLKLLSVKIKDNLKPLLQIFEHFKQKDKLIRQESSLKPNPSSVLQINISQIFITLVCEIDDQQLYLLAGQDLGKHLVTEYQPLFSIEGKILKVQIQKQSLQKSNYVEIRFPFEINYFNSSMNSFEPVIEKTCLQIQYQQSFQVLDQQPEEQIEQIKFELPHLANINLSITLFDTFFRTQSIFKLQKMIFSQYQEYYIKNILDNKNQSQTIEDQKNKQDSKNQEKKETIFQGYTIRNQTGELLLFRTRNQKIMHQLQPDEELPLDFSNLQSELPIFYKKENKVKVTDNHLMTLLSDKPWECSVDSSSSYSSDHESDHEEILNYEFQIKKKRPQSFFRKNNFHFLRKQPRILVFQILIQRGLTEFEKSKVFQISVEGQTWQRIILDQKREKYVVCQVQQADGRKYVVIRSPFQFVNHLHFPIEITLGNREDLEESSLKEIAQDYEMLIQPQSINIIPLRACDFTQVQMRPVIKETTFQGQIEHSKVENFNLEFEWTDRVNFTLLKNETELFEQKPLILDSKMLRKKGINQQFPFQKTENIGKNNRIYMVLNANTFNRRGFVDFNTQQTEFIQIKYLSVSPPFVFKNLVPIPITIFFKNLQKPKKIIGTNKNLQFKKDQAKSFAEEVDNKTYDLDLKHNSEVQILYLNPLGNFDLSLIIPGYQMPNFQKFKSDSDEDLKLCEDIKQSNFINALFSDDEIIDEDQKNLESSKEDGEMEIRQLRKKTTFRFSQMKTMQFNLTSKFQNQFNLSVNIAFIQGQYHISFYSQYWLINNTFMPLDLQLRNASHTQQSEKMALPYKRNDFDFCLVEQQQDCEKLKRKNSGDTFITTSQNYKTNNQSEKNVRKKLGKNKTEQIAVNNIDYKVLTQQQRENKGLFGRIKPWEAYKFQQQENEGLLGLLDQQDIDSVQVVYFTQEDYCEETKASKDERKDQIKSEQSTYTALQYQLARNELISQATSQNEQRYYQARMRIQQQFQQNAFENQSVVSKNSIQMLNYQSAIENMQSESLVHTPLSNSQLFSAPFEDMSQLKRIVLYSENFTPVVETGIRESLIKSIVQGEIPKQLKEVIEQKSSHELCLKICDSEWTVLPLDPAKLQTQSIILKDKSRRYCTASMYELVASIQNLPHPFNLSMMIEFKSRFIMINQTSRTIQVIQADCEEQGLFKIYPLETTNFHWTDGNKPKEINVKFDDHEYSGNLKIDTIGEMSIRLRATSDTESVIIQVQVSEQNRQFQIVFTDISYAPPYRIENLTKTSFKISQEGCRPNDFDILHPYQIIGYAWSYSQLPKFLNISISTSSGDSHLGSFNLENISKQENFKLNAKSRKFSLQITQEKTIKTIQISYEETVEEQSKQIQSNSSKQIFQISINEIGFSLINQYELAYIFIKNLKADLCNKNLSLQIGQIQIDNQLKRERSAIVFCRDQNQQIQNYSKLYTLQLEKMLQANYFINLQFSYIDDTSISVYKYFYLVFNPFCFSVDGNFCDEIFRYIADIKGIRNRQKDIGESELQMIQGNKISLSDQTKFDQKIAEINEEKKNNYGQVISEELQKKVHFEEFFISKIKINFSFNSSPVTFNELGLNSTLKFFIVLMSNLKKVNLSFEELNFRQQQSSMTLFFKQIKRHYLRQCFNHHQILKILLSNGLFGNISQISSSLSNAIEYLVFKPFNDESLLQGLLIRGASFISQSISALFTNPIFSFLESLKGGAHFLYQNNQIHQNQEDMLRDQFYSTQDLYNFDKFSRSQKNNYLFLRYDENLQIQRDFCILGDVQNEIDTQNQIWFKTILKHYYQNETKRQFLLSKQKINFQTQFPFNFKDFQQNQLLFSQNSNSAENINDSDFQEFSLDEIHNLNENETNKQLELFSRRQDNSQYSDNRLLLKNLGESLIFGVKDIPKKLISKSQNIIHNVNQKLKDEKWDFLPTKTRPPRFTSFTMQVEPYNLKKAICLEILNEINFSQVVNKENIQKFYVFGNYAIILTGKRLICVLEEDLIKKTGQIQNKLEDSSSYLAKYMQSMQTGLGGKHDRPYMHWNVLFDDIVKIKLCLKDRQGRVLDKSESQRICRQEIDGDVQRQSVMVNLKIIFTEQVGSQETYHKIEYLMNDFRVDSRDILVQIKDSNALLKVVNQIHLRSLNKIN